MKICIPKHRNKKNTFRERERERERDIFHFLVSSFQFKIGISKTAIQKKCFLGFAAGYNACLARAAWSTRDPTGKHKEPTQLSPNWDPTGTKDPTGTQLGPNFSKKGGTRENPRELASYLHRQVRTPLVPKHCLGK